MHENEGQTLSLTLRRNIQRINSNVFRAKEQNHENEKHSEETQ